MNNIINEIESAAGNEYRRQYPGAKSLGHSCTLIADNINAVVIVGPAKIKCRVQSDGDVLQIFLEEECS